ncbi:MAG: putative toxin-antitoxin system toxin component, PIN family [Bacillota bacterium]|nr:putative toxin-antitoxin system toxin component, PIN family [Bacillota bacterium]
MIIVLDTNVLVSGLLKGESRPGLIINMVAAGKIRLAYDFRIISEYGAVLRRPRFQFRESDIAAFLKQVEEEGVKVNPAALKLKLPDSADLPFIEVAAALKTVPLVTGNIKHFPAELTSGIRILTPAELYEILPGI